MTDKMDIVVMNGVVTRREIAEIWQQIVKTQHILVIATKEQIINYLRVQDESNRSNYGTV